MVIWYNVIEEDNIDIDFDIIFKYVQNTIESDDIDSIEEDFKDNIETYLHDIYKAYNFVEEDNDYTVECIINNWEEYINAKKSN